MLVVRGPGPPGGGAGDSCESKASVVHAEMIGMPRRTTVARFSPPPKNKRNLVDGIPLSHPGFEPGSHG